MVFPLSPNFGYSRVVPGLQRLKLIVRHLSERHDPLLEECARLTSRGRCSLVKVRSDIPLISSPSRVEFSGKTLTVWTLPPARSLHDGRSISLAWAQETNDVYARTIRRISSGCCNVLTSRRRQPAAGPSPFVSFAAITAISARFVAASACGSPVSSRSPGQSAHRPDWLQAIAVVELCTWARQSLRLLVRSRRPHRRHSQA